MPSPAKAAAAAYVSAIFMTGVDMQIVNVALPTLSRDFSAPLSDVQLTVICLARARLLAPLTGRALLALAHCSTISTLQAVGAESLHRKTVRCCYSPQDDRLNAIGGIV